MGGLPDVSLGDPATRDEVTVDEVTRNPARVQVTVGKSRVQVTEGTVSKGDLNQGGPEPVTGGLPDGDLGGRRMTAWERAWVIVCDIGRQFADAIRQVTATPEGFGATPPESWAQYRAYVNARPWVPDGVERGWLITVPVAYYNTLGSLGFAVGHGIAWVSLRMSRFIVAVVIVSAVLVLSLCFG